MFLSWNIVMDISSILHIFQILFSDIILLVQTFLIIHRNWQLNLFRIH